MAELHHTLANRVIVTPTGCMEWTGYRNEKGYGIVHRHKRVHRLSYELSVGPIPEGLCVLHRCDNPACCNPDHLFVGTKNDNNQDCIAKGRNAIGQKHGHSKLTPEQVLKIRSDTRHCELIAAEYGITFSLVCMIRRRDVWKHLP